MGQRIHTEQQIIIDLSLCEQLDLCFPRSNGGKIEWMVPEWTKTPTPTHIIFKNFSFATKDVKSTIIHLMYTRDLAGNLLPDNVRLTIAE